MPKMSGDKLSIEALKIRTDIPIIVCTGYHENFTKADAIKAGIKKYIQKGLVVSDILCIFEFNQLDNQLKPLLYELVFRF